MSESAEVDEAGTIFDSSMVLASTKSSLYIVFPPQRNAISLVIVYDAPITEKSPLEIIASDVDVLSALPTKNPDTAEVPVKMLGHGGGAEGK